jgi:hypothetical protein
MPLRPSQPADKEKPLAEMPVLVEVLFNAMTVVVTSPLHSLTRILANKRRKLVQTPDYDIHDLQSARTDYRSRL